jgi:ribose transport system ATP-binding protein
MSPPILILEGLTKRFGSTLALAEAALEIGPGEVHGLVGQNGSGKSTLIKILSGYHAPDAGEVRVRGRRIHLPASTQDLRRSGVSFVHQDLGLVDSMSVLENLRLGRFETDAIGRIRWRRERARTRALLRRLDLAVDPGTPIGRLTQSERAIVAIARALQDLDAVQEGLLVLDEPTASLPEEEVGRLFQALRRVRAEGSAVLFVSHKLDEVLEISDRVSVLRDGRLVATRATAGLDQAALIQLVLGRTLSELYPQVAHRPAATLVEVAGLSGAVARDVSFAVRAGEILGLTGLVGAGHDELPYLLVGARRRRAGRVAVRGRPLTRPSPRAARRAGLALLPADRARESGIPGAAVRENVSIPFLGRYQRPWGLDRRRERREVTGILERMGVTPRDPERSLRQLSGGNQQKALLGRWFGQPPAVLVLCEPAQGVDVGSRHAIFEMLLRAAADGMSIVYASAEYEDLAHVCDRVLVLRGGRVVRELAGPSLTEDEIASACYGG